MTVADLTPEELETFIAQAVTKNLTHFLLRVMRETYQGPPLSTLLGPYAEVPA